MGTCCNYIWDFFWYLSNQKKAFSSFLNLQTPGNFQWRCTLMRSEHIWYRVIFLSQIPDHPCLWSSPQSLGVHSPRLKKLSEFFFSKWISWMLTHFKSSSVADVKNPSIITAKCVSFCLLVWLFWPFISRKISFLNCINVIWVIVL